MKKGKPVAPPHTKSAWSSPKGLPFFSRKMNWWVALLLSLPFLFQRSIMHVTELPRAIMLSVFIFAFLVYFYVLGTGRLEARPPKLLTAILAGSAVIHLGIMVVSSLTGLNGQEGLDTIVLVLLTLLVAVLVAHTVIEEADRVLHLLKAFAVVLLLQSLVGILQFYGLAFTQLPPIKDDTPYGLMAQRNMFSSFLCLLWPFAACVLYLGDFKWKLLSSAALGLGLYALIIGNSRSAWIALATGILAANICVAALRNRLGSQFLKGWGQATVWFALGAALAFILALTIPTPRQDFQTLLKAKVASVVSMSEEDTLVTTGNWRFRCWRITLRMILDHPWTGVGPGSWRVAAPHYGFYKELFGGKADVFPDHTHNAYLQTAAETGIPGILSYICVWITASLVALRTFFRSRQNEVRVLALAGFASICIYSADSIFSFPHRMVSHSFIISITTGVVVALYEKRDASDTAVPRLAIRKAWWISLCGIAMFAIYFCYTKMRFEHHNLRARAYMQAEEPEEVLNEVNIARTPLVSISHYSEPLEFYSAWAYRKQGRLNLALTNVLRGLQLSPWNMALKWEEANTYLAMERWGDAIRSSREALALAPHESWALGNLAAGLYRSGQFKECADLLAGSETQSSRILTEYLARSWIKLQEYQKAGLLLREAVGRFPDEAGLIELSAIVDYSHLGNNTNAYRQFKRLLQMNPNHPKREDYMRVMDDLAPKVGVDASQNPPPASK